MKPDVDSQPVAPFIATRSAISRRRFLQGTGIALALPFLDAMLPSFARATGTPSALGPGAKPRRMLAVCNNLGLLPDYFFPKGSGRDYKASPYLELLQAHRNDFSVFTGVSHPNVDGGHPADVCFLTAAPHPGSSSFRNTISLDQHIAESIGILTRFPSLTLSVNTRTRSLSWTGTGVQIPPEDKAAEVFKQLFFQGNAAQVEANIRKLDTGKSILDTLGGQAPDLPAPTPGVNTSWVAWVPVKAVEPQRLAFDHAHVLAAGVERARAKLEYSSVATAFCGEEFTIADLRRVYEAVWGVALDPRNFHRKTSGTPGFLVPTGRETAPGPGGGRPAALYRRGDATLLHPAMLRPGAH